MAKIGFIGLGVMGAPTARNLQSDGHTLFAYKRSGALPEELVTAGPMHCDSLHDACITRCEPFEQDGLHAVMFASSACQPASGKAPPHFSAGRLRFSVVFTLKRLR